MKKYLMAMLVFILAGCQTHPKLKIAYASYYWDQETHILYYACQLTNHSGKEAIYPSVNVKVKGMDLTEEASLSSMKDGEQGIVAGNIMCESEVKSVSFTTSVESWRKDRGLADISQYKINNVKVEKDDLGGIVFKGNVSNESSDTTPPLMVSVLLIRNKKGVGGNSVQLDEINKKKSSSFEIELSHVPSYDRYIIQVSRAL